MIYFFHDVILKKDSACPHTELTSVCVDVDSH